MRLLLLVECIQILLLCTVYAKDCPHPCICYVNADEESTLTVDCRNQELFEIPLGIPPTTSHLDVSYNSIQFVRAVDLQNLPVLTYLQLHTNQIVDIESGAFESLPTLETLALQNNLLMMLRSGTFNGLSNLRRLNLLNNYIEELDPEIFRPLENLIFLNLDFNSLEFITTGTFFNLSRLFDLNLRENFIGRIDREAIGNLPFLRTLNLEGNQLQSVPTNAWVNVPLLRSLSLDRNPLECGCDALWLRRWFLERSLRGPVMCGSPADLQGRDLLQLTPDDFCRLPTATIMETDPIVLSEGMTLQLTCVTSGAPPPITTWSRKGMTIDLMNRLDIDGNSLVINNVIANDSGRYFCSASSTAGTAAGSIDVVIVKTDNVTIPVTVVSTGDTAVLECEASLLPSVDTMWRFNSTQLDMASTTAVNFTGRFAMGERGELVVFNIEEGDMGRYECVLTEEVSFFRDLEIQAAPQITITPEGPCETPNILSITTGDSIRLMCTASGVPTPSVTWTTPDGDTTMPGEGSATVPLVPPMLEDAGVYICMAINEIGVAVKNITVNVMAVLGINMNIFTERTLLVGMTAILNCSVPNMTTIDFQWGRVDRLPLPPNSVQTRDGTLIIPDVQMRDIAVYECQAVLGERQVASLQYGLAIFEPPRIAETCPQPEPVLAIENEGVSLNCMLEGNPRPTVVWTFRNATFRNATVEAGGRFSFSNRDSQLDISEVEMGDGGVYTCTATNTAGRDVYEFLLEVQEASSRPFFLHQPAPITDAIAGSTARLPCEADGFPTPTISWFMTPQEADTPVTQILPSQRFVVSPEELVIFDVRPSDEGFYFCGLENEFVQRNSTLGQFNVWTPPRLQDSLPIQYLVVEGTSSILIPCNGSGDPEPDLHWLRDNGVLPFSTKQRILPNGSLEIFQLSPEDAGEYMCRLANAAGEVYLTVNVIVRAIPRTRIDPRNPSPVDVGSELSLFCSDMGTQPQPLETLEWRRDDEPLVTEGNVVVFPSTGELVLSDLQLSDSGNYSCEISSYVGSSVAFVLLSVENPFLASGVNRPLSVSSPTALNQTLATGQTAQFACVTSPPPPPVSITWLKDGLPLRNLRRYTVNPIERGSLFTIANTLITDEAEYSCIAENSIGERESISFTLTISTLPFFTWPPEAQQVIVGQNIELRCKAGGRPRPLITWLHNGMELMTEGCVTINATAGSLSVCNTTALSGGRYSCLAQNLAGSVEFSVPVTVIPDLPVAPVIINRTQTSIIMAGEPLILDCIVSGSPRPSVTWLKDGVVLNSTCPDVRPGNCSLVDDVSVYIQITQESDSGTYSCVAENAAGIAVYDFNLLVEPESSLPIFLLFPTLYNQSDQLIIVQCVATGHPDPLVSWLRATDFVTVSSNNTERIYSEGNFLFIRDPVPSDSGHYICRAENTAGINQFSFPIWVGNGTNATGGEATRQLVTEESQGPKFQVPPHNVSTYEGLPVAVPCSTEKTPDYNTFTVWRKAGQPLYQDDTITIATNGSLIIQRSKVKHSGTYDCMAVSEKGVSMATIYIQILTRPGPPDFLTSPVDLRVTSGDGFSLPCQPDSPSTSLTWLLNGQLLVESCGEREIGDDGSLHVIQATPTSSGVYTCRLSNQHATVDVMATVTVTDYPINNTVTVTQGEMLFSLHCGLEISPSASETEVNWTMGLRPLIPSHSFLPFGARLLFLVVDSSLEGEYTCTYSGQVASSFLEVLVPPHIVNITSDLQVTSDKAIHLHCVAIGKPTPQISWFLEGNQLQHSVAFSPLQDGSLYLHPPLSPHQHNYTCVATNQVGVDKANTLITVL